MATKTKSAKITSVRKGDIYETNSGQLIEVTSGRLQDEGEHGSSFEGRTIEFNLETGNPNRSKTADRFYLDELAKKLSKKDYDEWVEIGRREAEALVDANNPPTEAEPAQPATKKPGKTRNAKTDDKLSQLDAAVKVLSESGEPMTTKAMIEAMAAQGYWTSPGGATPWATLYSALIREIANKGDESRFTKIDRGQFALNGATTPAPKATGKKAKPADGTPGPKSVSDLLKM
ncbi:winged helix-turn-helix domain-containing protein [Planctomicrobium sp. SH661]|uniref:winged helix-turn-helix domain-containing protein n=1 Tax=Planctomicrobium sp. SH661 TaxID=3448124 RepID=UPI003F5C485B